MAKGLLNRSVLDRKSPLELVLELLSFSGGENKIGADHELKSNEARTIKNWDATSLGTMIRSKGFNEVGDGGVTYSEDIDLLIQHFETTNTELYGVIEGDLFILSGSTITQEDAAAFTSGVLCHAVSAGAKLWITNSTDNLQYKSIGNAIATPTDQPATACDRIYFHLQRLIAEGSASNPRRVYGSVAGSGNWTGANAWTTSGDAWNIDLPDDTKGCMPDFPSGPEVAVWTKFKTYSLYNFPNVAFRAIPNSFGCSAPYSIARGNEGVFFVSEYPTKGVILWDGVNFINLTEFHDFVDNIDLSKRCFGIYKDRKYHLFYNESGSGVTYPNRWRIYDTRWGRWMEREINSDLSDTFGYPALLTRDNNELYVGSSQKDKLYELETSDTDDEGNDTQADYKTKDFSSRDFSLGSGGAFGIDNVRMKLIGMQITYNGTVGNLSVAWSSDKGRQSGSQVINMTAEGDKLNIDFILNTSILVSSPGDRTIFRTFNNKAVGRNFNFQILNSGQGARPEIKKLKIYAIALDE